MEIQNMIKDILGLDDWSEQKIANEVNCRQPTINRIKTGKMKPSYEVGTKIVALHKKLRRKFTP